MEKLVMRSYSLISADSHVNPPPTFWRDYLKAVDPVNRVLPKIEQDLTTARGGK